MKKVVLNLVLAFAAATTYAAGFPERDIQLVVPFEPGGAGDITSRLIAESANELLNAAR